MNRMSATLQYLLPRFASNKIAVAIGTLFITSLKFDLGAIDLSGLLIVKYYSVASEWANA